MGDEGFRELSQVDPKADELLDKVRFILAFYHPLLIIRPLEKL